MTALALPPTTAASAGPVRPVLRAIDVVRDYPSGDTVIHALTEGLVFQRLMTPDLVPDEVFYAAFAALAGEPPPE